MLKSYVSKKSNSNANYKTKKYPVLILGYNRPEKVLERTKEILSWNPLHIYISIDGCKSGMDQAAIKIIHEKMKKYQSEPRISLIFRNKNFGLREHLPTAVTEVLKDHDAVIVIEDDIKCSHNYYQILCKSLQTWGNEYMTIGGFASLPISLPFLANRWRKTKYFSAWGWGITRESWSKFEGNIDIETLQTRLSNSEIWNSLNDSQKEVWTGRFLKIAKQKNTWDFQMQYSAFVNNLYHLNSLFRISENLGFNDSRGANTNFKRPLYLGSESISNTRFKNKMIPNFLNKPLQWLDSIVIAGDRSYVHKSSAKIRKFINSLSLKSE